MHRDLGTLGWVSVRVAVAPDGLTERERTYAVVTSEPYLSAIMKLSSEGRAAIT
jgi:hypothetical protein